MPQAKEFFENGAAAFRQKKPSNHSAEQERIAWLEKKIQTKDEALAELMAEHVALKTRGAKKSDWGTLTGGWVPRDFWLEDWHKQAIIGFRLKNPAGRMPPADLNDAPRRYRGGDHLPDGA